MIKGIFNKLKSEKGASALLALVTLLVTVMISSVIVYTAFSNLGRIRTSQGQEQDFLAVSSAVNMCKAAFKGDSVSYTYTETQKYAEDFPTSDPVQISYSMPIYKESGSANHENFLQEQIVACVKANQGIINPPIKTLNCTVETEVEGAEKQDIIKPVNIDISFDGAKDVITFKFAIKDTVSGELSDKYKITMRMDMEETISQTRTSGGSGDTALVSKTDYTISFANPQVRKGNS